MSSKGQHLKKRNAEKPEDYFHPTVQNVVSDQIFS